MKSILEQMFFGKKFKADTIPYADRGMVNLQKRTQIDKKFCEILTAEQRERFTEYTEEIVQVFADEDMHYYIEGVKIGILIGLEATEVLIDK